MTLTPAQKKLWQLALVGFATGVLSYVSALAVGAPLPGWRALIIGAVMSGVTRMSGSLLAKVETTRPPGETRPN